MQVEVVGLSGGMGTGKDTVAENLGKVMKTKRMSFAEPIYEIAELVHAAKLGQKRALHDLYALLVDIFGGPQNAPSFMDVAILMNEIMSVADQTGLVECALAGRKPRAFLQQVGTELIRNIDEDAWANYLNVRIMRDAYQQISDYRSDLDSATATIRDGDDVKSSAVFKVQEPVLTYVITDLRFPNEVTSLRCLPEMVEARTGLKCKVFCLKLECDVEIAIHRVATRDDLPVEQVRASLGHASEAGIPDDEFDFVIDAARSQSAVASDVASIVSGAVVKIDGVDSADGDGPRFLSGPGLGQVIDLSSLRQQ